MWGGRRQRHVDIVPRHRRVRQLGNTRAMGGFADGDQLSASRTSSVRASMMCCVGDDGEQPLRGSRWCSTRSRWRWPSISYAGNATTPNVSAAAAGRVLRQGRDGAPIPTDFQVVRRRNAIGATARSLQTANNYGGTPRHVACRDVKGSGAAKIANPRVTAAHFRAAMAANDFLTGGGRADNRPYDAAFIQTQLENPPRARA